MHHRILLASLALLGTAACFPKRDLPPEQIAKLTKLAEVMDVQATVADPQFDKIGRASYTDADWAAFADVGNRIGATSQKTKEFSKGPAFDALADTLHAKAEALSAAAASKDPKAASDALAAMKSTCKECHSTFR